jgi:hypothetical protein
MQAHCGAAGRSGVPQQEAAVKHLRRDGGGVALAIAVKSLHPIPHPERAGADRAGCAVSGLPQVTRWRVRGQAQ